MASAGAYKRHVKPKKLTEAGYLRDIMKTSYIDGIKSIEFQKHPENELDDLAAEIKGSFWCGRYQRPAGTWPPISAWWSFTIALQRAFDTPKDKIIFDVGHQTYVNKILTGRAAEFPTLRQMNGLCGLSQDRGERI